MSEWAIDMLDEARAEIMNLIKERDEAIAKLTREHDELASHAMATSSSLTKERDDLLRAANEVLEACYLADDGNGWEVRFVDKTWAVMAIEWLGKVVRPEASMEKKVERALDKAEHVSRLLEAFGAEVASSLDVLREREAAMDLAMDLAVREHKAELEKAEDVVWEQRAGGKRCRCGHWVNSPSCQYAHSKEEG